MTDSEKIKILLIDDDSSFYELFKVQIETFGLPAIFDYKSNFDPNDNSLYDYDIIFIDNMFYGQPKAAEFVAELHQKAIMADLVVMSGYGDMRLLKELINIGVAGYIDKDDINMDDVRELLQNSLDRKKIFSLIRLKVSNMK